MGRVQVGQVYEARHPGFSSNAGDPLGSFRVDVRVFEVPCERERVRLAKLDVRGVLTWSRSPARQGYRRCQSV